MKKIILCLAIFVFCSCSNDDNSIDTVDGLIPLDLTKDFLVGEKWFLEAAIAKREVDINGDGNATKDLSLQFPTCDLDSYYQFERTQEDFFVLVDDGIECEDFDNRFPSQVYDFEIDTEDNELIFDLTRSQLLGGIENKDGFNDIDRFQNVKCLISPDSSLKILKGQIQFIENTSSADIVIIDYSLKASIDDRPEISL